MLEISLSPVLEDKTMRVKSLSCLLVSVASMLTASLLRGQPGISIDPSAHDYGSVTVGTNASHVFTISNTGSSTLIISTVSLGGADATQFTITDPGGSSSVPPAGSIYITVRFNPSHNGSMTASLIIYSNAAGSPHSASLIGTGKAFSTNPISYNFGSVSVGDTDSKQFTITNNGTHSITIMSMVESGADGEHFSETIGSTTIAASSSTLLTVYFSPISAGAKSISLTLNTNDSNEPATMIPLSGTGLAPDIDVSPSSPYDYHSHDVGTQTFQVFTISNTGTVDLHVSSVTLSGGIGSDQFSITDDAGGSFTVSPAGSETITVRFNPTKWGAFTASLLIASDDPDEATREITLNGTGLAPDIAVTPVSYYYGTIAVGSYSSKVFTISNSGNVNLDVSSVSLSGGNADQYAISDDAGGSFSVAPAGSETITVQFMPTSAGSKSATVVISSNDPGEPSKNVPLLGTASEPDIEVVPAAYDYGEVAVGYDSSCYFIIRNKGDATLTISSFQLDGDDADHFFLSGWAGGAMIILPADSDSVLVHFSPTSSGSKTASLLVNSDDPDEPVVTVPLSGNGADTAVKERDGAILTAFRLMPNYPNPFNSGTIISYHMPRTADVRIDIYDASGRFVRNLVRAAKQPGAHEVRWDGTDSNNYPVCSGLYIVALRSTSFTAERKVMVVR